MIPPLAVACLALALLISAPVRAEGPPAPIPVEALFAGPAIHSPRISPDAATLALVHQDERGQLLMTQPLTGGKLRTVASLSDPSLEIRELHWAGPERLLVRLEGEGSEHLVSVATADGKETRLPEARVVQHVPGDPDHVAVAVDTETGVAVSRMHVESGALERLQDPVPDVVRWHVDPKGRVRAATLASGELRVRRDDSQPFVDAGALEFGAFAEDEARLYVFRRSEGGRRAVFELALGRSEPLREVFAHPEHDVSAIELDGRGHPIGATYLAKGPKTFYFTPAVIRERLNLDHKLRGTWNEVVSSSLDGGRQLVRTSSPTRAPRIWLYDRTKRRVDPILAVHPDVPADRLSSTRAVSFEARDGVSIPAFLTLPKGHGESGLPTLIFVHDGPRARDGLVFDPRVQLFASRGIAVFQIQYRGSFGYGRDHEEAGHGEWGLRMQADVEDGARWLVAEGIADGMRLAIHGEGYGGYAAVQSLVATPTLYAAASSYGGFFDLEPFARGETRQALDEWRDYVLGPEPRGLAGLRAASPLHRASEIRRPVFLAHGSADSRSPVGESRRLAEALGQRAHAVTWLELDGADQHLRDGESRVRLYSELVAFYEAKLAPRTAVAAAQ